LQVHLDYPAREKSVASKISKSIAEVFQIHAFGPSFLVAIPLNYTLVEVIGFYYIYVQLANVVIFSVVKFLFSKSVLEKKTAVSNLTSQ